MAIFVYLIAPLLLSLLLQWAIWQVTDKNWLRFVIIVAAIGSLFVALHLVAGPRHVVCPDEFRVCTTHGEDLANLERVEFSFPMQIWALATLLSGLAALASWLGGHILRFLGRLKGR